MARYQQGTDIEKIGNKKWGRVKGDLSELRR